MNLYIFCMCATFVTGYCYGYCKIDNFLICSYLFEEALQGTIHMLCSGPQKWNFKEPRLFTIT